jgi:peptidoglycan/LPS O-acetylase OafA/YrhL
MPGNNQKTYLYSADTLRFVATIGVLCLHTAPFYVQNETFFTRWTAFLINNFARFAVSYFFIISGYFYGATLQRDRSIKQVFSRFSKRILGAYLFWSAVFLLMPKISMVLRSGFVSALASSLSIDSVFHRAVGIMRHPSTLFLNGIEAHLWFFPALFYAALIVTIGLALHKKNLLFVISFCLYVIGLLGQSYSATPIGIDLGIDTRNGPFWGTLLFYIGYIFSDRTVKKTGLSIFLIITGFSLQLFEMLLLAHWFNAPQGNYFIGTVPLSIGLLMLVISMPDIGRQSILPTLGKLSLGIYASHVIFLLLLINFSGLFNDILWQFIFTPAVYLLTLIFVYFLSQIPVLKKFVT